MDRRARTARDRARPRPSAASRRAWPTRCGCGRPTPRATTDWSPLRDGHDLGAPERRARAFAADTAARSFPENTAAGTDIGTPLAATDADTGDTLTYSLGGTDAASFDIDSRPAGNCSTKSGVTYDFETKSSFAVTVTAIDGKGGSDSVAVTVTLTDVPPPGKPAAPTFGTTTSTSLVVNWLAPENTGPVITDYDVQYREEGTTDWTDAMHDGAARTITIGSLDNGAEYEVQVRASSAERTGEWSDSGTATTTANDPPAFGAASYAFTLVENADGSGTAVDIGTVSATDPNAGQTVTYSIEAGNTGNVFAIDSSTGAITYVGGGENYEAFADPANAFVLTVRARDDHDGGAGSADVRVTVSVTDVADAPAVALVGITEGPSPVPVRAPTASTRPATSSG